MGSFFTDLLMSRCPDHPISSLRVLCASLGQKGQPSLNSQLRNKQATLRTVLRGDYDQLVKNHSFFTALRRLRRGTVPWRPECQKAHAGICQSPYGKDRL